MIAQIIPALYALGGAFLASLTAVIVEAIKARSERRVAQGELSKASGTIRTTEAETLWLQKDNLYRDVIAQLESCKKDTAELRQEIMEADQRWRTRLTQLEQDHDRLLKQLKVLEAKRGPRA